MDGIKRYLIKSPVVTLSPIHSMVVVTSPIGDQAPPALAAIIISPANHARVFRSKITFCRMVIKTMVAVRLSIIADKIKARMAKIHNKPFFWVVLIKFLIVKNPLK